VQIAKRGGREGRFSPKAAFPPVLGLSCKVQIVGESGLNVSFERKLLSGSGGIWNCTVQIAKKSGWKASFSPGIVFRPVQGAGCTREKRGIGARSDCCGSVNDVVQRAATEGRPYAVVSSCASSTVWPGLREDGLTLLASSASPAALSMLLKRLAVVENVKSYFSIARCLSTRV
jgi:hypothetical protein